MNSTIKKMAIKVSKILGITIAVVLFLLFIIPILFPGTVAQQVKNFANQKLAGELNFSKARLSFFDHFPSLTVTLDDFSLKGSAPFEKDTLIAAKNVSFGINLKRLIFDSEIRINKLYISKAMANVMVDEKGRANYNVYIADPSVPVDTTSNTALRLDKIDITDTHIKYYDKSTKMLVDAQGFNYVGKGDLSEDVFDLATDAQIEQLDFYYNGAAYMQKKKVHADLITRINTNSLAFMFRKNELLINKLPIKFNGFFKILKDGYDIDVTVTSIDSQLEDLFGALPAQYLNEVEKGKFQGRTSVLFTFKGNYNASRNFKPDMAFNMDIRDGYIQHPSAPFPASNIYLDLKTKMPSLNTDSLSVELDTLAMKIGGGYARAKVKTIGLEKMKLKAAIVANVDLGKIQTAFNIKDVDMKGVFRANIKSEGQFDYEKRKFPVTEGIAVLENASIKTPYYPNPITEINFKATVINKTGEYKDLYVALNPATFTFEQHPFFLTAIFKNFEDINYNVRAKGDIDVAKIYKVFSRKGLDLKGYIKADLSLKGIQSDATNGHYERLDNKGTLLLSQIKATSELFPKPFYIREGRFSFHQDKMRFDKFIADYGHSDFAINGHLRNVINYIFSRHGTLNGSFNVNSNLINVDEFMALKPNETKKETTAVVVAKAENPKQSGVVLLPKNLDVALTAQAKKVNYTGLTLSDLKGTVALSKGRGILKKTNFNLIGCKVNMDADYEASSPTKALFNFHLVAKDFDVQRAYKEIELFREVASAAEKAEGIISADYTLNGALDGNMSPITESLVGAGTIQISKVKVSGLKLFNNLGAKTGLGVEDPDLSKIDINTTIKNNVITVERFRMKVSVFRIRLEGETNLKGPMDFKLRVGLPPFGLIGIPVMVTGTHDKPNIKIFSKTHEDVEETKYDPNAKE